MNDLISRQAAIDTEGLDEEIRCEMCENPMHTDRGCDGNCRYDEILYEKIIQILNKRITPLPSAQPEIIHCYDCIYYDPEHIEKNGVRYEYEDMPKDAFDILGTGLVNSEYGINVGGRCCRDYNVGYSEDKRVFVSKQNYCGRAERRQDG